MSESFEKIIFFDIETNHQHAPYAELQMIGYQISYPNKPQLVNLKDPDDCNLFRSYLADPEWTKVHFNGINFDEIVLKRYGYPVIGPRHDVYLMAKTVNPQLPAFGLKFLNWYFYNDWHESERKLRGWCKVYEKGVADAPFELRKNYCLHDVVQTVRLYKLYLNSISKDPFKKAYFGVELPMAEPLHEITLEGGDFINVGIVEKKIKELTDVNNALIAEARTITKKPDFNPVSSYQAGLYLSSFEKVELKITDEGNFSCTKDDLLTLLDLDNPDNDTSRIARIVFEVRANLKQMGYLRAFRRAALFELRKLENRRIYRNRKCIKIPKSYNLSRARTRRFTSSSYYGINFQNQNKFSKAAELVPPGWMAFSIDLTQIENVVHIYESKDIQRRKAYEADEDYNEYVWLGNTVLGTDMSKDEMDSIKSKVNDQWSVYKQFKTTKLAMNFGMGVALFATKNGLPTHKAKRLFETIHNACPAIHNLQNRVAKELIDVGYVSDPFGHIYSGEEAYKVVAYLIQGCGTGSIPKVMTRAVYDTLHSKLPKGDAYLTGLTHDEIGFRIRLTASSVQIADTLRVCMYDCTGRFSHLFDSIPIRAKLYYSSTSLADLKEIKHPDIPGVLESIIDNAKELTDVNVLARP